LCGRATSSVLLSHPPRSDTPSIKPNTPLCGLITIGAAVGATSGNAPYSDGVLLRSAFGIALTLTTIFDFYQRSID
ncbi:MAG: hypothetical protein ACKPGT_02685, partial [Microcystis sp.]